ncbi:MAG: aspartate 1-decarboxylase [Acidobacteriota bacterium]|nr:MAG: aspartate 1-decarboxylase [Acidobacteriota bacterium]
MRRRLLLAKIHRAVVTEANLDYVGSLTLDQALMDAAGLRPYEQIDVYNVTRGTRLTTYLIPGAAGEGDCCINGAAAHLCERGDRVIICAFADLDEQELDAHRPRVVLVHDDNTLYQVKDEEQPHTHFAAS